MEDTVTDRARDRACFCLDSALFRGVRRLGRGFRRSARVVLDSYHLVGLGAGTYRAVGLGSVSYRLVGIQDAKSSAF